MSPFEAAQTQKKRLRRRFRDRRDGLGDGAAAEASAAVCRQLGEAQALDSVASLAGYMARGNEIDIRAFLADCLERGVRVALPRVVGPGKMEFCRIGGFDELEPGSFGIEEPTGPATSIDGIDAFLVPGLAFDRRGHRLGFGMGYYDRALPPKGQALAIGIAHHWQLVDEELPVEAHDRAMDQVVTDRELHFAPADELPSQE